MAEENNIPSICKKRIERKQRGFSAEFWNRILMKYSSEQKWITYYITFFEFNQWFYSSISVVDGSYGNHHDLKEEMRGRGCKWMASD